MSTRRITVEEVLEAYRVTGLKPRRGNYLASGCACGIGAVAFRDSGITPSELDQSFDVCDWAETIFGKDYHEGFIDGFDEDLERYTPIPVTDRYGQGFADGQSAAAAVFQKQGAQT